MTWHDLRLRLSSLLRLKHAEAELDEELQFHLEMETRKHIAAGLTPTDARKRAQREFGGMQRHQESCRDARGTVFVESLLKDIRYACRGFLRAPGFALTVIATIGLALGLNTTLFTIFNAYVLRPLAVRDPDSLYRLTWTNRAGNDHLFSWAQVHELQNNPHGFADVVATTNTFTRVEGRAMTGALVSANYFRMLGVGTVAGRPILPEDAHAPVVVISHATWMDAFGGNPDAIGKNLTIRGTSLEVIGVAPPEFGGIGGGARDFWAPLAISSQLKDGPSLFAITGRLKPEMTVESTRVALLSWVQEITKHLPQEERAHAVLLQSQATMIPFTRQTATALSPVFIAFALVLIIACVNVANMILSRTLARRSEIGVRLSLGAGRGRLVRQLLTESFVLAIPAAAFGFLLSRLAIYYGQMLVIWSLPVEVIEIVRFAPLTPDLRILLYMLIAALACTLLFGLAPALQATRYQHNPRPGRLRAWLIVSQVSCCVLLLICSGVLLRAARKAQNVDTGLLTKGVIVLEVKNSERARLHDALANERIVVSQATASSIPLNGSGANTSISAGTGAPMRTAFNLVSPEYFPIVGIPIASGRNFTAEESRSAAGVAIVSRSTAQHLFGSDDAIGRVLRMETARADLAAYSRDIQVIGIAGDVACESVAVTKESPCIYLPASPLLNGATVFVKVREDDEAARRHLDALLASKAPAAVQQMFKFSSFLALNVYPFKAASWVCGAIGTLALLLTLTGVYGVLSYLVTQRTREIGIRVALGATRASVIAIVMRQSLRYCIHGILIGAAIATVLSHLLASKLLLLNPLDPVAYSIGIGCVAAAALIAAYFPSRRAAKIDPALTLRCDG